MTSTKTLLIKPGLSFHGKRGKLQKSATIAIFECFLHFFYNFSFFSGADWGRGICIFSVILEDFRSGDILNPVRGGGDPNPTHRSVRPPIGRLDVEHGGATKGLTGREVLGRGWGTSEGALKGTNLKGQTEPFRRFSQIFADSRPSLKTKRLGPIVRNSGVQVRKYFRCCFAQPSCCHDICSCNTMSCMT